MDVDADSIANEVAGGQSVASLDPERRGRFILRVYGVLSGAVLWIILIAGLMVGTDVGVHVLRAVGSLPNIVLLATGASILSISGVAARRARSTTLLVGILAIYSFFCSLLLLAVLFIVVVCTEGKPWEVAVPFLLFGIALVSVVLVRRRDVSFVGTFVVWVYVSVLLLIVVGLVFDFSTGAVISAVLASIGGTVLLYQTSEMLARYSEDRSTAAALEMLLGLSMLWILMRRLWNA